MTGITYTPETGLTVPTLTAGDIIDVSMTPGDAAPEACRIVVSGPIRGGERALLATSGPLTAASGWTAELSLATTQVRDLMRGLLPTDSISARVELIDEASGRYIAGITGKLRNSSLTWAADALSAESFAAGDSLAAIRASLSAVQSAASAHAARTDNPHAVTAEQVVAARNDVLIIDDSGTLPNGYTTVTAPCALVFRFSGEYDQSEFTFFIDNFFSAAGQNRCRIFQLLLINYSGINRKFTILASGYPVTVSFGYGRRVFTFSVIEADGDVSCDWLGMYNYSNSLVLTDTADATNYQMKVTGGTLSLEEINV